MRKKIPLSIFFLFSVFVLLLIIPTSFSASLRERTASIFFPIWDFMTGENSGKIATLEQEIKKLQIENNQLRNERIRPPLPKDILSARVIFRSHAAWQSYLWIDIGSDTAPYPLKNAPVLIGDVLLGVIEEVAPRQSRVRLITDPDLIPSVRVDRAGKLLAKGELRGARRPSFRQPGQTLFGTGFNYDFPDNEGDALPLSHELIKPDDLLVTTGFDGVFPKGLKVAKVTKVIPLKEGDFYFDIEAQSLITHLNSIESVHILPPLNQ